MKQHAAPPSAPPHPRLLEPLTLALVLALSVLGGIVGMQILVHLGVTPNTAIIGALVAMTIARIPLGPLAHFRSIHRQNLAQSAISAATFGAANALLLPIGIPFALGRPELVLPMLAGAALAMLLDAWMMWRTFGSEIFPAEEAWPPGVAAAEAIRAGDEGGRKAALLGFGALVGAVGAGLGVPMSGFGVAFIGNPWALLLFGAGLLARGYERTLFAGADLGALHVPHGMMLGAGLAALVQVVAALLRRNETGEARSAAAPLRQTLGLGFAGYLLIAGVIALAGGLFAQLSPGMLAAFLLYAAGAAYMHELIVGLAAMHSGWFPAFAVAVVTLLVGVLIGFPPASLALLVGFSAATGPAFADMGCDLKAGWLLRGRGTDAAFEIDGRRQQFLAALAAFAVAIVLVALSWRGYFAANQIPPVDRVFAAVIQAGLQPGMARQLAIWGIAGAMLQFAGGSRRQMGVLFATGLLIVNPAAGWAVLAGLAGRLGWLYWRGTEARAAMEVFAGGVIAGDALVSFCTSALRRGG